MRRKFAIGIFVISTALASCLCSCNTSKTDDQSVEATTQIQEASTEITEEDLDSDSVTKMDIATGEETILSMDDMSESDPEMEESSDGSGDKAGLEEEIEAAENAPEVKIENEETLPYQFKTNIYGDDDRHIIGKKYLTKFPNRAVIYLNMRYPNNKWYCGTGYMIGRNTIATAAHCIYSYEDGGYPVEMRLYPGKKGDYTPYGMTYATDFIVPTAYINLSKVSLYGYDSAMQKVDYGIIHVNNDLGDTLGWFGYRTYESLQSKNKNYHMVGYYDGKLTTQQGKNLVYSRDNKYLEMYFDVVGGQSGSPVFFDKKGDRYVIGHLTSGNNFSNGGVAMTKEILGFYNHYKR